MGGFFRLDPRRLAQDVHRLVGDSREHCTLYRRATGAGAETKIGVFWARVANIGRQTTGLEQSLAPSNVTGSLWVLLAPPGAPTLLHRDEIRSNSTRWRIVHVRQMPRGQIGVLENIQ